MINLYMFVIILQRESLYMKKYYSLVVLIAIVLNRFLLSGIKMTGIVHDICSIILIVLNIQP